VGREAIYEFVKEFKGMVLSNVQAALIANRSAARG